MDTSVVGIIGSVTGNSAAKSFVVVAALVSCLSASASGSNSRATTAVRASLLLETISTPVSRAEGSRVSLSSD